MRQRALEHVLLDLFQLRMEAVYQRPVILHHEAEQGVEDEVFAMFQEQRARFATLANAGVGCRFAIAGADDVALAGEQLGFDELQFTVDLDG
ncbi:hypothetical protein D3C71_2007390 [compost metagenome]